MQSTAILIWSRDLERRASIQAYQPVRRTSNLGQSPRQSRPAALSIRSGAQQIHTGAQLIRSGVQQIHTGAQQIHSTSHRGHLRVRARDHSGKELLIGSGGQQLHARAQQIQPQARWKYARAQWSSVGHVRTYQHLFHHVRTQRNHASSSQKARHSSLIGFGNQVIPSIHAGAPKRRPQWVRGAQWLSARLGVQQGAQQRAQQHAGAQQGARWVHARDIGGSHPETLQRRAQQVGARPLTSTNMIWVSMKFLTSYPIQTKTWSPVI
mmetsp:Transcript_13954/g.24531  ORF Transcript_13954/g.24531 Transcript_13954/m.24531 type:complete len:266 (-) Transcript_13954:288-1085(-)